MLPSKNKYGDQKHRCKAERSAEVPNYRRIVQTFERKQGNRRDAGHGHAGCPLWDCEAHPHVPVRGSSLRLNLMRLKSYPGQIGNGNRERQIPQAATGIEMLLNQDVDDRGNWGVNQERNQIMPKDLLPAFGARPGKVSKSNDHNRQFSVIKQIEVSVEAWRIEVQVMPYEDEVEV